MSKIITDDHQIVKPFLRWAGGKNWLVKHFREFNINYSNYHEAFLGGGAIFFSLNPTKKVFLSDLNSDLINTYQRVKEDVNGIIEVLKAFENSEDDYYRVRSATFDSASGRAAQFIYLNQTSFNGIYRVNLKGKYNVPYGYRKKDFVDEIGLQKCHQALKRARIFDGDFEEILGNVKRNDLVFLDPPYTVSHNLNGFIKYNEHLFSLDDQIRLSKLIDAIKQKDAFYILTNAAHHKVQEIFDKGDRQLELSRASLIGGFNAKRGDTSEYIFTNIDVK